MALSPLQIQTVKEQAVCSALDADAIARVIDCDPADPKTDPADVAEVAALVAAARAGGPPTSAPKPRRRGWVKPAVTVVILALVAWVATAVVRGFTLAAHEGHSAAGIAIPAAKPDPVGSATAALDAAALEEARKGLEGLAPLFDGVRRRQAELWGDTPTARAVAGAPEALAMFRDAKRVALDDVRRQVAELTDQVGAALASAKGDRLYDTRQAQRLADGAKVGGQLRKQQAILDRIVALSSGATPGTVTASEAVAAAEAAKAAAAAEAAAKAKAQAEAEVEAILARNPGFVGLMATVREGGELRYERSNSWQEGARRFLRGDGGYPLWHYLHAGEYQTGGLDLGSLGSEKSLLGFRDYCRVLTLQPERFPDAAVRARHPGMYPPPTGEMGREISVEQLLDMRLRDLQRKAPKALLSATWETRP